MIRRLMEQGSALPRLADPFWEPTDAEIEFYHMHGRLPVNPATPQGVGMAAACLGIVLGGLLSLVFIIVWSLT